MSSLIIKIKIKILIKISIIKETILRVVEPIWILVQFSKTKKIIQTFFSQNKRKINHIMTEIIIIGINYNIFKIIFL